MATIDDLLAQLIAQVQAEAAPAQDALTAEQARFANPLAQPPIGGIGAPPPSTGGGGGGGPPGGGGTVKLPAPPSYAGKSWNKAWLAYQANPVSGYKAYYDFLQKAARTSGVFTFSNFPAPGTQGAPDFQGTSTGGATTPPASAVTSSPSPTATAAGTPGAAGEAAPGTSTSATGEATPGTSTDLGAIIQQIFGNAGGAQQADRSFGGASGGGGVQSGGNGPAGNPATSGGQPSSGWNFGPNSGFNLGTWGSRALQAATLLPKVGGLASLAQLMMRGYNTANSDAVRSSLGLPGLDIGQVIGSLMGWNNYGSLGGNQTFANNSGVNTNPINHQPVAVTQGGMYDQGFMGGGPFGIFSDMRTAYTPDEKLKRDLLAHTLAAAQGGAFGGNAGFGDATGYSSSSGGYGYRPGGAQSYDAASGAWGAPNNDQGTINSLAGLVRDYNAQLAQRAAAAGYNTGGGGNAGGAANNAGGQRSFGGIGGTNAGGFGPGGPQW